MDLLMGGRERPSESRGDQSGTKAIVMPWVGDHWPRAEDS